MSNPSGQHIVLNGCVIFADPDQPAFIQRGIKDLADYLAEITGAPVPVKYAPETPTGAAIAVGPRSARQLAPDMALDGGALGAEGFAIRALTSGGAARVLVAGATPQGTKYGLAHLLKLIRSEDRSAYLVGPLDLASKPSFRQRGMHLNGWVHNHPYSFRVWKEDDWKRYIDLLTYQGANLLYLWPFIEIIPIPLSPEDESYLQEVRRVVDYAQKERGMEVWIMHSGNRVALSDNGVRDPRRRPYWNKQCQVDMNPAEEAQFQAVIRSREALYRIVNNADGFGTIDGDPGSFLGSSLDDLLKLLKTERAMLDRYNEHGPQTKMIVWLLMGWGQHGWDPEGRAPFIAKTIRAFKAGLPEPWQLLVGAPPYFAAFAAEGVIDRSLWMPYGAIESEPCLPNIQMDRDRVCTMLDMVAPHPTLAGMIGNAQTPLLQLPHTLYFLGSAWNYELRQRPLEEVTRELAQYLYPEQQELIAAGYMALDFAPLKQRGLEGRAGTASQAGALADKLTALLAADGLGRPGVFARKLFPDHRQAARDLAAQLRIRAAQENLFQTVKMTTVPEECARLLEVWFDAVLAWEKMHGYQQFIDATSERIYWPVGLIPTDRRILPFDERFPDFIMRLKWALIGRGPANVHDATIDAFLAPIAERLLRKYGHNQVMTGCIRQMKTALTLGILY